MTNPYLSVMLDNTRLATFSPREWHRLTMRLEDDCTVDELHRQHRRLIDILRDRQEYPHDNATHIQARVSLSDRERLRMLAEDQNTTVSGLLRKLVQEHVRIASRQGQT